MSIRQWPLQTKVIMAGLVAIPVLLAFKCHLWHGPLYYRAEPLTATVVDEVTGKPVEGALVIALWRAWSENPTVRAPKILHSEEAVTAADGSFRIPGWGPKVRPPFLRLDSEDPGIIVYKPGYLLGRGDNSPVSFGPVVLEGPGAQESRAEYERLGIERGRSGEYSRSSVRRSFWNGKIMVLPPADTVEHERDALSHFREAIRDSGQHLKTLALTQERADQLERMFREQRDR